MLETDIIIFYMMGISLIEKNASDVIYSAYIRWFIICFRSPFVCSLNDFTEVYSFLWIAVY